MRKEPALDVWLKLQLTYRGGGAAKAGDRYEGKWIVFSLVRVLEGRAEYLLSEPPGEQGEGIDFILKRGDTLEYHQVKRQRTGKAWTISELNQEGVLAEFAARLAEPSVQCHFVSVSLAEELRVLSERARHSTFPTFIEEASRGGFHGKAFSDLARHWKVGDQDAYDWLKRVFVRNQDETSLTADVQALVGLFVDGAQPETVVDILAQFALETFGTELTAKRLWEHLDGRNCRPLRWGQDPAIRELVDGNNERYMRILERELIASRPFPRRQTDEILGWVGSGAPLVMCVGDAGAGKSGVALQVVDHLAKSGTPLVAIRIDRLNPVRRPDEVGAQLGFPGSPVRVLASLATGKRAVLLLDQLDAVSTASGRHPAFLETIDALLLEAGAHSNLTVLLCCRRFDLEKDVRFRRLVAGPPQAEIVEVGPLTDEEVASVLRDIHVPIGKLDESQLRLLRLPLHLRLLEEVREGATREEGLGFRTAIDLYEQYADYKRRRAGERLGDVTGWDATISTVVEYMGQEQTLRMPRVRLTQHDDVAGVLLSERVLVEDGAYVSFFHEGFFDYLFGRAYASGGHRLLDLLISGEQHLFRRAQVRQVLAFRRETDLQTYLRDLQDLLASTKVRFHIKSLVGSILARLSNPSEAEWRIVEPLVGRPDAVGRLVDRLVSLPPWFDRVDSLGVIDSWLHSADSQTIARGLGALWANHENRSTRAVDLLRPHVGDLEPWPRYIASMFRVLDLSERPVFDFFLTVLNSGVLDRGLGDKAALLPWAQRLARHQPAWFAEFVGSYFARRSEQCRLAGDQDPFAAGFIPDSWEVTDDLMIASENAPAEWLKWVLPWVLDILERTATRIGDPPWSDPIFGWPPPRRVGHGNGIDDVVLAATGNAIGVIARSEFGRLAELAAPIFEARYRLTEYLGAVAYTQGATQAADHAVDWIRDHPTSLLLSYQGGVYVVARNLVAEVSRHASDGRLRELEDIIARFYPDYENNPEHRDSRGMAQLMLLNGIDPVRISPAADKRRISLEAGRAHLVPTGRGAL